MKFSSIILLLLVTFKSLGQQKFQVFFDFNKEVPNEKSIEEIKNWLANNKKVEVVKMIGYCDSVDKRDYNKDLAMRRITSILSVLKNNEIKISDSIELKALGKDFKLSMNQNENRKVEVFYISEQEQKKAFVNEEGQDLFNTLSQLVAEEKSTLATKFANAKKGDLIRINNINFYFNSEKVMDQSMPLLTELLQILLDNPKLRIEIHGHICCNPNPMDTKLSFRRAIVIFKYLTNHGIPVMRLAFKGFGSNDPIYPLPERTEAQRAANRRVEILIVNK